MVLALLFLLSCTQSSYQNYNYNTYSGGGQIQGVLAYFQSWGIVDGLLPFLLLFALVFAILQKIALFTTGPPPVAGQRGKPDKKLHAIIALAIAALVVLPHITGTYPDPNSDPVNVINKFLPSAAILLLVILMVVLLTGLVAFPNLPIRMVTFGATIILMLSMLFQAFPSFAPGWLLNDPNLQAIVIVLLVFGLIIWFITREDTPPGQGSAARRADNWLRDIFGEAARP